MDKIAVRAVVDSGSIRCITHAQTGFICILQVCRFHTRFCMKISHQTSCAFFGKSCSCGEEIPNFFSIGITSKVCGTNGRCCRLCCIGCGNGRLWVPETGVVGIKGSGHQSFECSVTHFLPKTIYLVEYTRRTFRRVDIRLGSGCCSCYTSHSSKVIDGSHAIFIKGIELCVRFTGYRTYWPFVRPLSACRVVDNDGVSSVGTTKYHVVARTCKVARSHRSDDWPSFAESFDNCGIFSLETTGFCGKSISCSGIREVCQRSTIVLCTMTHLNRHLTSFYRSDICSKGS